MDGVLETHYIWLDMGYLAILFFYHIFVKAQEQDIHCIFHAIYIYILILDVLRTDTDNTITSSGEILLMRFTLVKFWRISIILILRILRSWTMKQRLPMSRYLQIGVKHTNMMVHLNYPPISQLCLL